MTSPSPDTDYYLLDELLTDEARDVRDRVRTFVDTEVLPVINDYWDRAEFPFPLVAKIAELGISARRSRATAAPGLSRLAAGMVTLEMSRGDGSVNTFIGVQSGLAMGSIALLGSEEQKQRWLPGDGPAGEDRRVRADRTRARLRLGRPGDLRPSRRRRTGCSTGPSAGSATPASPT